MKQLTKTQIILTVALVAVLAIMLWPHVAGSTKKQIENENTATTTEEVAEPEPEVGPIPSTLAHRQEVWLYALEWCESRGFNDAINEVDLDGTPSYYAFQFKPGTFRGYGEKYGVIPKGLSDAEIMELLKVYELQREIVKNMIGDSSVDWYQQFPWCVKKLGLPPR